MATTLAAIVAGYITTMYVLEKRALIRPRWHQPHQTHQVQPPRETEDVIDQVIPGPDKPVVTPDLLRTVQRTI